MSYQAQAPVCVVFDSGMGGLSVIAELEQIGFSGRVEYAADTGFFPYGDKSDDALIRRVPALARALVDEINPDLFVIACNTASTLALEVTRAVVDVPVVGTVPAIKPAAKATQTGTIGVLATPGTLKRAYTDALITEFARNCRVLTHGSVKLVELAERDAAGEDVPDEEIAAELAKLIEQPGGEAIDQIVLACTHFPLIRDRLQALAPAKMNFIDSGEAIARRVMSLLKQDIRRNLPASDMVRGDLWTTGHSASSERLTKAASRFGFKSVRELHTDA